jgi:hypothetical protein
MEDIKGLTKSYLPSQLRTPLHAAVMISPLYLLAPIQLYAVKWDRQAMFLVRTFISLIPLAELTISVSRPPQLWEIASLPY